MSNNTPISIGQPPLHCQPQFNGKTPTLVSRPINSVTPIYFLWLVPIHLQFMLSHLHVSLARGVEPFGCHFKVRQHRSMGDEGFVFIAR